MKDDKPQNAFDLGGDNELSLDEIMAVDASDDAAEDAILNKEEQKDKKKKAVLLGSSGVLALAVTAGLVFLTPLGGGLSFNRDANYVAIDTAAADDGDSVAGSGGEGEPNADGFVEPEVPTDGPTDPEFNSGGDVGRAEDFAAEESNLYPIDLDDWQMSDHSTQDAQELKDAILAANSGSEVSSAVSLLPSEEAGFTNDLEKSVNSDGSLNPMFSFWTSETVMSETGQYIERLINPTFGNWIGYQYSTEPANAYFDRSIVADMFTTSWFEENDGKPYAEYVPIFADWEANNYGMGDTLLKSGSRWYGEVTGSETDLSYDNEELQYVMSIKAQVKFTAWANDQTKLEKTGTLTLRLVPNVDNENGSGHKVLIESANLEVNG